MGMGRRSVAAVAALAAAGLGALASAGPALAQGSAPGAPGASATWNEANLQGFADSLGAGSKVWYTLGDGGLENVFYPQTDTPGTFGLQYIVTDGSTFADTETAGTTHAISLADPTSLVWQQVKATADTTLSYKYGLGANWDNVQETADCGYVSNATMSVNGGTVNDTVANWAGPGACGDSTAVIDVTVPADTPGGDTVYLSGNYDVLGTGIPPSDDWVATDYPMIQTGPDAWTLTVTGVPVAGFQYKFTLGSWSGVEETASCGDVANRTFGFDTAAASYTATDTVAAWEGVGGC